MTTLRLSPGRAIVNREALLGRDGTVKRPSGASLLVLLFAALLAVGVFALVHLLTPND
jgi:hypothetical protein